MIDTLKAYIKFVTKLFHLMKCKTSHGKNEEKNEFGSSWNESLRFKCDSPIMFRPIRKVCYTQA
jgi:hypothetical protein